MKAVVVYDSIYGNTEKIARSISQAISGELIRASEVSAQRLSGTDLMIIGCPTYGGRPTEAMKQLLVRISSDSVKGVKVATFDTRLPSRFVKIFGFAAEKIETDMMGKGAVITSPPEGFFVLGREGPLKDGEEERAANWAKRLIV